MNAADTTPSRPCAHPNAHSLAYAYRSGQSCLPLARFIDAENHLDLLAGGITFNRPRARALIEEFLSRQCCSDGGCGPAGGEKIFARELPILGRGNVESAQGADAATLALASTMDSETRELAEEFHDYATRGGQVFISTHSPDFLNGVELEEIFWLQKRDGFTQIARAADDESLRQLCAEGDLPGALWKQGLFTGVDPR